MIDLVSLIAKSLVREPDKVVVKATETENGVTLELSVAPEDMGRVIGKQGRIAKAIRTLVKAASAGDEVRYNVEITD
ncbi:MAG: KH domain-containing protein [Christensenellales bacterium]|jgi:predicted RNA-binding protein YlqC (UPF0109 family)